MRNTIDILGVKIDSITMEAACARVLEFLEEDKVHAVYTPNAEILMVAQRDPELMSILNRGEMVVPDGAGVVLASKLLKRKFPQKVSGIDLVKRLFACGDDLPSYFLLGAKPGVAELARDNLTTQYQVLKIAGVHNGYFSADEEISIIEKINNSGANILLVALGAPKQEKWIDAHRDLLKPKVCIGVGGSFDVFAGKAKLAPEFIRKAGFEWLYRLCKEPRRFKRMLDLPRFIFKVVTSGKQK